MTKPIKIYSDNIEQSALDQFHDAMEQDFSVKGALMPDAHTGYSLPIGAVVATKDVIVPAWVGFDIGCGMCAIPTSFNVADIRFNSDWIFTEIYKEIPTGFKMHPNQIESHLIPDHLAPVGREAFNNRGGFHALGTLGGGNHFIEIGASENGVVWVIIHSGSRGVGHGIASEYMKLASGSDKAKDGHYGLSIHSEKGLCYINDMNWALEFALVNRTRMVNKVIEVVSERCEGHVMWRELINRNHNHAEEKDGLWIHRKGATHAENGMRGVIPGNMKDGSFIVKGKGNPDSLFSSSHGAGRVMGRKQAKRELDVEDFQKSMIGITAKVGGATLDEAPKAYKNIFEVMDMQTDLVEIITHVKPIINIKS